MFMMPLSAPLPASWALFERAFDFSSVGMFLGWGLVAAFVATVVGILSQVELPRTVTRDRAVPRPALSLDVEHPRAA